ncbi:hypothetical protein AB0O75_06030 [Streptomyces sp. NPDC088921]|uniref:hypothetical protein n=1 Tax=unclassified Streptomyces TaxID=2593676 RepID=UPI00343DE8B9
MPAPRTDLSAIADRLPGIWTSEYHHHPAPADQAPIVNRLWDASRVGCLTAERAPGHDAALHSSRR